MREGEGSKKSERGRGGKRETVMVGVRGGGRKRQGVLPELGSYMFSLTFPYYPVSAHSVHIHASVLKKDNLTEIGGNTFPYNVNGVYGGRRKGGQEGGA